VVNESGTAKITATVTVPEMALRRYTIAKEAIEIVNLPDDAEYDILSTLQVTVMGALDAFDTIDQEAIRAILDFKRLTVGEDGSYTAVPRIELGEQAKGVYVLTPVEEVGFTVTFPEQEEESSEGE